MMKTRLFTLVLLVAAAGVVFGCATTTPKADMPIDRHSVAPGEQVTRKGQPLKLLGSPIAVGQKLPAAGLVDAGTMKPLDLAGLKGQVLFLSLVPSIDTKVCEAQTHYLGEEGDKLPAGVKRITISRDTPFAQKRFAEAAKLTDLQYLSDYKTGEFGNATGLLVDQMMLLARSVILVDKDGVVRYIQVVPELTHLPDMEAAFRVAEQLVQEK
jgi:thiol peroxidase